MIEEAATQVLRGVNGLAEFFQGRPEEMLNKTLRGDRGTLKLIPVIFTTARLWISQIDLSRSDLADGILKEERIELKEVDYLYYLYHQSAGLKHSLPQSHDRTSATGLEGVLAKEYSRVIAVVGAQGIENFLLDSDRRFTW